MLLREKYDVLINVTWDCFDQSNFYKSRINIIEWNNSHYVFNSTEPGLIVWVLCSADLNYSVIFYHFVCTGNIYTCTFVVKILQVTRGCWWRWFTIDVPPSSLNLVLLWQLVYLFCSSIVINTVIVTAGTFEP